MPKPRPKVDLSMPASSKPELLIYQAENGATRLEVTTDGETVWLSQAQMAELFQTSRPNVTMHVRHVFSEGELEEGAVCKQSLQTAADGKNYQTTLYNLDVIISVGYRVKSLQGTKFRIWATQRLREYIVKGFTIDDQRLAEGRTPQHYYDELVERIREIRASEWNFYRKLTDLFTTALDYDPKSQAARDFFAAAQNKLHYAVHQHTAAELVASRADAKLPNMGLRSFKGARLRRQDVGVAKNYLDEKELRMLNLLVSQYLDFAELQAHSRKTMTMADWARKLDGFIRLNERELLKDAGRISAEMARELAEGEWGRYRGTRVGPGN